MAKFLTGLFRHASKKIGLVLDNIAEQFKTKIAELIAKKESLSDEDIAKEVDGLIGMCETLPETEGKAKLVRFLEDFKAVKTQDRKVAEEAAKAVTELFTQLDTEAAKDIPEAVETGDEENKEEEAEDEEDEAEAEKKEETKDEDEKTPSLEDIYEYVKKRMGEETQDGDEEDEKKEVTADKALPKIPVKLTSDGASRGGLDELKIFFDNARKQCYHGRNGRKCTPKKEPAFILQHADPLKLTKF